MIFSITSCGKFENKKAFEESKEIYNNISAAYKIIDELASDIYDAWYSGIYDDDELLSDGVSHLASELSLSKDEITLGVGYVACTILWGEKWTPEKEAETKSEFTSASANLFFKLMEDDMFSFCVEIVIGAYITNGKIEEARNALDLAKEQLKSLNDNHSDYEHYLTLKEYYAATKSLFDFCQDPNCSFEQLRNTLSDYENKIRDYVSSLNYIFED